MTELQALARQLRDEGTPISPHAIEPAPEDSFAAPGERAGVIEAVREGYLLHYGQARLVEGHDDDLALLAGDYLYALGIERLAALGDTDAVLVLAELIAASAQLHAEDRPDEAEPIWADVVEKLSSS